MNSIFTKLNYKAPPEIVVINAPDTFLSVMDEMRPLANIVTDVTQLQAINFAIAFVKTQPEVDRISIVLAQKVESDGVLWLAYPKSSSKKYTCDFNRDSGWLMLKQLGFEPVRQVAIDDDWTALRFRRVEYIKNITRQKGRSLTEVN